MAVILNLGLFLTVLQLTSCQTSPPLVTQTVYGFLDFTTTIGDTVMVFSPQSAAPEPEPPKAPEPSINAVIETKPSPSTSTQIPITIKPSKTTQKASNKPQVPSEKPKVSSVVQVQSNQPVFSSKIEVIANTPKILSSKVEVVNAPISSVVSKVEVLEERPRPSKVEEQILSSIVEVKSDAEPALLANNIGELEYDFLSRQPSEVVEETYKVINLKPSSKFHLKPRPATGSKNAPGPSKRPASAHPTGLVTKLGGTVVKDGSTTVHETSVIGTYISGKYAQVLQSTSHIVVNQKAKISPSPSLRILKTAAPAIGKNKHHHQLDPTPAGTYHEETLLPLDGPNNLIKATRRASIGEGSFKRFRNRKDQDLKEEEEKDENGSHQQHGNFKNNKNSQRPRPTSTRNYKNGKFGRTSTKLATVSVFSEPSTTTPSNSNRRQFQSTRNRSQSKSRINSQPEASSSYTRRGYKSRIQSSSVDNSSPASSTSLYKFKLNRAPGRWQYKTTQKPRVTIRKQNNQDSDDLSEGPTTPMNLPENSNPNLVNDVVTSQSRSDELDLNPLGSETSNANLSEESDDNKLEETFPLETIKVEISTPADFNSVYYEIATIKSPYTFQVGGVKNTRYITVTSTLEKTIEPTESATISPTEPLTENILATSRYDKDNGLESGIATLPPVFLASDMSTPPLETLTETFSTTQDMLKTHILPVVYGNETSSLTLIQTYHVTRLVTATKTLPPMEIYQFVPSKILKDFNSHLDEAGSELHLNLEFGDDNEEKEGDSLPRKSFPPDLNLANIGSDFDLSDVDKSRIPEGHLRLKKNQFPVSPKPVFPEPTPGLSPEQLQQLAILRLLNPNQNQVITTSKPVVKLETVYESHVIPIFNGVSTILSTISKPLGTVTKTEFEYGTSTVLPQLPVPQLPQNPLINPLFPQQQPQFTVTSTPVVTQTVVTETDSKVLKLTFGAKTAYTTILSTRVVPTVLTTYLKQSVAVQPTAAFPGVPGFFPPYVPPFPYVG